MSDINIGDEVRSYDFPQRKDCYVEGVVQGFPVMDGCMRYQIEVSRVVWEGTPEPAPRDYRVYPPINGTITLRGRLTDSVEKL